MIVEHILRSKGRNVVTIAPSRTLAEAARLLHEKKIGALLVVDAADVMIGILSERDIVSALAQRQALALDEPVARSMTADVVTCTGKSAINEVMELMTGKRFRHVPVVEEGNLAGIVSIGDLVKQRLAEVEAETRAMRDYIATA